MDVCKQGIPKRGKKTKYRKEFPDLLRSIQQPIYTKSTRQKQKYMQSSPQKYKIRLALDKNEID